MTFIPPKPPRFGEMVDAWDDPEAFSALVNEYYALCGALKAQEARDITQQAVDRGSK